MNRKPQFPSLKLVSSSALILLSLLLTACASRRDEGPGLAQAAGWRWETVSAGDFDVAIARSPRVGTKMLVVYLEGDGFAYVHPTQPSRDPTPKDPVALRLALADSGAAALAWIARPCQYTQPDRGRNCQTRYWTNARYAPEVVASLNTALDQVKTRQGSENLVLVGYSGGGALAMLLAARRTDVVQVVTVAANLDLDYWTRRDGLTPLAASLDPAGEAGRLGAMPQVHFTGGRDRVIGTDVTRSYIAKLPAGTPVRLVERPDFTHACCWARDWPVLAAGLGW